jgi:hypothetical protein
MPLLGRSTAHWIIRSGPEAHSRRSRACSVDSAPLGSMLHRAAYPRHACPCCSVSRPPRERGSNRQMHSRQLHRMQQRPLLPNRQAMHGGRSLYRRAASGRSGVRRHALRRGSNLLKSQHLPQSRIFPGLRQRHDLLQGVSVQATNRRRVRSRGAQAPTAEFPPIGRGRQLTGRLRPELWCSYRSAASFAPVAQGRRAAACWTSERA